MYRCDNEFIKENSEFRDIMERGAGGEYAPRESTSLLKYVPRESVGVVVIANSLINTAPPKRG